MFGEKKVTWIFYLSLYHMSRNVWNDYGIWMPFVWLAWKMRVCVMKDQAVESSGQKLTSGAPYGHLHFLWALLPSASGMAETYSALFHEVLVWRGVAHELCIATWSYYTMLAQCSGDPVIATFALRDVTDAMTATAVANMLMPKSYATFRFIRSVTHLVFSSDKVRLWFQKVDNDKPLTLDSHLCEYLWQFMFVYLEKNFLTASWY